MGWLIVVALVVIIVLLWLLLGEITAMRQGK